MIAEPISGQSGAGQKFVVGKVARQMLGDVTRGDLCRYTKAGLLDVRQLPNKRATYSIESIERLLGRSTTPARA
jgi:hypothetical protein